MTEKKYFEVKISCTEDVAEMICAFLIEHGALGACEENAFVERSRPVGHWISVYFKGEEDYLAIKERLKSFLNVLKSNFDRFNSYRIVQKWMKDKNWREDYKKHFKTLKVSKRIVVKPDHTRYKAKEGEHIIVINPQMAFGIGNHPTTKMCIQYIDELIDTPDTAALINMLDAGAGSGILSIAAVKLGVREVYGFDNDQVAVDTAQENIEKNGVVDYVKLGCHGISEINGSYDLVVANILASILIKFAGDIIRATKKGGDIILSGILGEQKDEVVDAYLAMDKGIKFVSDKSEDIWIALHFKKM